MIAPVDPVDSNGNVDNGDVVNAGDDNVSGVDGGDLEYGRAYITQIRGFGKTYMRQIKQIGEIWVADIHEDEHQRHLRELEYNRERGAAYQCYQRKINKASAR